MKFRHLFAYLAAACIVTSVFAQDDEDEDNYIDLGFYADAKSSVRFGFRVMSGAKVGFHNVGNVVAADPADATYGAITRLYSDGYVYKDAVRTDGGDGDANGNQLSTPGGRYQLTGQRVDSNGNPVLDDAGNERYSPTYDALAYTSGQSRIWNIQHAEQLSEDGTTVAMHLYSALTEGAGFDAKKGMSSGVELQMAREIKKFGRFTLGLTAGLTFNGINGKRTADVTATLHTLTDTYTLKGTITDPDNEIPYTAPYFTVLYDPDDGTLISTSGYEATIPITDIPSSRTITDTPGAAHVEGFWKLKGAYYALRLGPELRANLPKGLSVSIAAGVAGTFAGTTFSDTQHVTIDGLTDEFTISEENSKVVLMSGYYANLDAAWAINERSGLFAGLTYEQLGKYSQTLSGQTATIDLSGQSGVHGGLSIKF